MDWQVCLINARGLAGVTSLSKDSEVVYRRGNGIARKIGY